MNDFWILGENKNFIIKTPKNPHISPREGCHIVIYTKDKMEKSWDDPKLAGKAFELAAKISKVLVEEKIADWVNIQNNQNWDLLPGDKLEFHINIYGRRKSGKTWGQPVELPKSPGTFKNEPMSQKEREILARRLKEILSE
jgi:diadenosine tetraphosphate (Ap4A) HIT family hydrolase